MQELTLDNCSEAHIHALDLWKARFYYLHDKQMTSNVTHLKDKSLDYYEKYLSWLESSTDMTDLQSKKRLALMLTEQSHCYLNFYKYKQAKNCIKRALSLLELNVKLTGRLGRRTKYQEFDIA
jgi:hypothetical protein